MEAEYITIAFISFMGVIFPGPACLIVLKNSLSHSRKIGLITAIGVSLALIIHLSYTFLGISYLLVEGTFFYSAVKLLGALYLLFLGFRALFLSFKKVSFSFPMEKGAFLSKKEAFRQGFFTNLLNPESALFFLSLFSQFIVRSTPAQLKVEYAFINWGIALLWYSILTYLVTAKAFVDRLQKYRIYSERIMGCAFIFLSLKLLF